MVAYSHSVPLFYSRLHIRAIPRTDLPKADRVPEKSGNYHKGFAHKSSSVWRVHFVVLCVIGGTSCSLKGYSALMNNVSVLYCSMKLHMFFELLLYCAENLDELHAYKFATGA